MGTWITVEQATNLLYWLKLVACDQPMYGIDGIGHLLQEAHHILLEIGAGKSYPYSGLNALSAIASEDEFASIMRSLQTTLGKLWLAGVTIDWATFYQRERRLRVPLPTYPFERQRYWIDRRRDAVRTWAVSNRILGSCQILPIGSTCLPGNRHLTFASSTAYILLLVDICG